MKRYILTLAILATTLTALAQATQPCLVLQYNQKQKKTPLGGVQVTVTNAGSTVSGADGRLTLSFRTLKPGAHVNFISAKKAGYEVFNSGAIKSWNISSEGTPFPIVLVRSDYFNQLKENLGKAPSETYEAQYRKAIRELEQQKLREEEFQRRYDELEKKYHEQLAQLENYIDLFARIDLSEVSAEEQRILDMMQQGKIDEALAAYEELGLLDKLETEAQAFQTLNDAAQQKKNNINELYEAVQRQVAVLIQANKKKEAEQKLLQLLATITPMYEISQDEYRYRMAKTQGLLGEVAAKSDDRGKFLQAALNEYTILYSQSPDLYLPDLSRTEYLLGSSYHSGKNFAEKEKLLLSASDHYTLLFKQDTLKYGKPLMETQTELGWIYKVKEDWAIAEKYYLTGLDLATLLAQLDPIQYFQELDPIQEALANFYLEVKDTVRAEKYMCMSVESRIQMFIDELGDSLATSPKRIIRKISRAWKEFYLEDLRNLDKAEKFFLKQINRFTQLSEQKPRKYGEILLEFIGVLSSLFEKYTFDEYHLEERGYDSKDPKYLAKQEEYELKEIEALKFLIQLDFDYWGNWLAKANFSADYYKNSKSWVQIYLLQVETCLKLGYNEGAMEALYKLEYLYLFELKDYIKAEDIYLKELENLQQLYEQDSSSDNCANLAKTQYRLGELYYFYLKDYAKAEDFYLKALTNRTQLYEKDSSSDNCNDLAWTQFRLGELYYLHLKDYAKAEEYYLKALENYTYLFTQDPDAHHADLAMTLNNLGSLYDDLHDYAKAEEYFLKVFENYTKLFSQNPDAIAMVWPLPSTIWVISIQRLKTIQKPRNIFVWLWKTKQCCITRIPMPIARTWPIHIIN